MTTRHDRKLIQKVLEKINFSNDNSFSFDLAEELLFNDPRHLINVEMLSLSNIIIEEIKTLKKIDKDMTKQNVLKEWNEAANIMFDELWENIEIDNLEKEFKNLSHTTE